MIDSCSEFMARVIRGEIVTFEHNGATVICEYDRDAEAINVSVDYHEDGFPIVKHTYDDCLPQIILNRVLGLDDWDMLQLREFNLDWQYSRLNDPVKYKGLLGMVMQGYFVDEYKRRRGW